MLIISHADHHNQLEEQALRYEAAGRQDIADLIREQAKNLTLDKPLPVAQQVLEDFDAGNPALFEATQNHPALALPDTTRRPKGRKRIDEVAGESTGDEA